MRRASLVLGLFWLSFAAIACGDDAADPPAGAAGSAGSLAQGGKGGSSGKGGTGGSSAGKAGTGGAAGDGGTAGSGAAAGTGGKAGTGGDGGGGSAGEQAGGAAGEQAAGTAGAAGQAGGGAAGTSAGGKAGAAGAATKAVDEVEPNNGTTLTEVNPLVVGTPVNGAIGSANDADIFKLEAIPGKVYVVRVILLVGTKLQPHLAVFDAGRGKKAAGEDYTKISKPLFFKGEALVELLAMGEGGYFIGVRDARNVADPKQALGDATFTYRLEVTELSPSERVRGPLPLPGKVDGTLASDGALDLYAFDVSAGQTLSADFLPKGSLTSLDGRFFVYSDATKDWVARNDNRSETNVSPLFDEVPLQPTGPAYLVVENIEPNAMPLDYSVTAK